MMHFSRATVVVWLLTAMFGADLQQERDRTSCPIPTVRKGGVCVLSRDTILDQPLRLADSTTLDCRGHALLVRTPGIPCDLGGGCGDYRASVPEVAVYVNVARGVTVRNCAIRGFDFGIVVADSKVSGALRDTRRIARPNQFYANELTTRIGVEIVRADLNIVRDNTVRYAGDANGVGIIAWGDSDFNEFRNNRVTAGNGHGTLDAAQWPGSRPARIRPDGIRAYSGTQARSLINVIVGGHLTQTISDENTRQEGTIIEHNSVDIPPSASPTNGYAIVVADQTDVRVQDNTVRRALQGLHVSGMMGMLQPPGTCSAKPWRRCLEPRDCFLPGVDSSDLGSCALPQPRYNFSTTTGLRFVGNHILGPLTEPGFSCAPNAECSGVHPVGIAVYPNAIGAVVEGNDIAESQFLGVGIILKAAESVVVRHNVVHDSAYALGFIGAPPGNPALQYPAFYRATITRNDFSRSSVRPIYASTFFSHPADISDSDSRAGNYWGRTCDTTNGFRSFDAADAEAGDSPRKDIIDSFAFGEPVARRASNPPLPCVFRRQPR